MNKVLIIERKVNEAHAERERNQKKRNRFSETQGQNQNNQGPHLSRNLDRGLSAIEIQKEFVHNESGSDRS